MPKLVTYSAESPLTRPCLLIQELLRDLWKCRELTWVLFKRDLKAQYRQSYFGYVWLIAPPLVTTLIWVFLNAQRIVRVETETPYPLFVLIGTTIWMSLATTISAPLKGFSDGRPVFTKLKVPPEAFILSGFYRAGFDLLIRLLLLVPVFLFYRISPPATALLLPLGIGMVLIMGLAMSLAIIPLSSLYGDAANAVNTFMGLLLFTVPVVYPIPEGNGLLATVMRGNPLTPAIAFCREVLTDGTTAWLGPALAWSAVSLGLILAALLVLRIAMPHLVARMGM